MKFDSTSFDEVIINGIKYGGVLVIGDSVIPRGKSLANKVFGTSHAISNQELEMLIANTPDVIIVGTGQSGALEVREDVRKELEKADIELEVYKTTEAIRRYNEISTLKKVNALVHTTC